MNREIKDSNENSSEGKNSNGKNGRILTITISQDKISKEDILGMIPNKDLGLEVNHTVIGTKSTISLISIRKQPLYILKEYLDSARDVSGIEGAEAAKASYELEKAVLESLPKAKDKLAREINDKSVQAFPVLSNKDDKRKSLLLEYIPYPTLIEELAKVEEADRIKLVDKSLDSWMFLCDKLSTCRGDIEKKLGHELKKMTAEEETQKFLRYIELFYGIPQDSWSKKLKEIKEPFSGALKMTLKNETVIHGSYYADHVRLNESRSVNIDAGNVRIGPPEMDIGCLFSDISHLFTDVTVPVRYLVGKYAERKEKFYKESTIPNTLSEEGIYLFVLVGSLKKGAGIKLRKNKEEMPQVKILTENISRLRQVETTEIRMIVKTLESIE